MKYQISSLLFLLLLVCSAANGEAQSQPALLSEFKGNLVDAAGAVPRVSATFFNMKIEKYTSDEDVVRFANILAQKGPEALVDALHDVENGRVRIGSRLSYHLSVTRMVEKDGKRIVRALTDRPIAMIEAWRNPRSMDYPFGFIELVLDSEGKGEGKLTAAAKIEIKGSVLEMESYGLEPFRILSVSAK